MHSIFTDVQTTSATDFGTECHPSEKSQLAEVLVLIYGPDLVNVSPDAPGTIAALKNYVNCPLSLRNLQCQA